MAAAAPSSLCSLKPRFGAGGVEEVEVVVVKEGGGVCYWLYERRGAQRKRERVREERERGIQSYLNGNQKRTEEKGPRVRNKKKVETGLIYARKKPRHSLRKKRAIEEKRHWIFFFSKCVFLHSHDSKRIPVKFTRSGGIDGVLLGRQSRGEESECARLNHASFVDHNFGDHFKPRWVMFKDAQFDLTKTRETESFW